MAELAQPSIELPKILGFLRDIVHDAVEPFLKCPINVHNTVLYHLLSRVSQTQDTREEFVCYQ